MKEDVKSALVTELADRLGSYCVNVLFVRIDSERNARGCYRALIQAGSTAPARTTVFLGELLPNERNTSVPAGQIVAAACHDLSVKSAHESWDWFARTASSHIDISDEVVVIHDRNESELMQDPIAVHEFRHL